MGNETDKFPKARCAQYLKGGKINCQRISRRKELSCWVAMKAFFEEVIFKKCATERKRLSQDRWREGRPLQERRVTCGLAQGHGGEGRAHRTAGSLACTCHALRHMLGNGRRQGT